MDLKLDWLHYRGKSPAGDQSALCRPAPGPALTFLSFILLTKITAPVCQEFSCLAKSSLQSRGVFLPFHFETFSSIESSKYSRQRRQSKAVTELVSPELGI